eukprot:4333708-Alexandrium_andersonii.AAC.1
MRSASGASARACRSCRGACVARGAECPTPRARVERAVDVKCPKRRWAIVSRRRTLAQRVPRPSSS